MFFHIETFGCKLNQAESDELTADFLSSGFVQAQKNQPPDLIILNCCAVTHKAVRESRQRVAFLKRRHPHSKIIVTGCLVQQNWPKVDLWVGNFEKHQLPSLIQQKFGLKIQSAQNSSQNIFFGSKTRTFIKIQSGCDNFCSYCIVPFLRGRPKSVSTQEIVNKIKAKEKLGFKEVVLTGVNIGKYGLDIKNFKSQDKYKVSSLVGLLKIILTQTKIERIRLSSLWPTDLTANLINLMSREKRLCPHLHLSLQSGSSKILRLMNRLYTSQNVILRINQARRKIKLINFTADFIMGFPSETDADFQDSCNLVKQAGFGKVHIFHFSQRPGTSVLKLGLKKIADKTIKERIKKLETVSAATAEKIKHKFIGEKVEVLFEKKTAGFWQGYSQNYFLIRSKTGARNKISEVKIKDIKQGILYA